MITVVNKKHKTQPAQGTVRFYCGRGSVLGNPYTSIQDAGRTKAQYIVADRDTAIAEFKKHMQYQLQYGDGTVRAELGRIWRAAKQGPVELECYCAPLRCHCEVIKEFIEQQL